MHPLVRSLGLSLSYSGALLCLLGAQGIAGAYYLADKIKTWRMKGTEQKLPPEATLLESWLPIKHVSAPERVAGQLEIMAIEGKDYLLDPTPHGTQIQGRILSIKPKGGRSTARNITYMPYTKLPSTEIMNIKTYLARHVWPAEQGLTQKLM